MWNWKCDLGHRADTDEINVKVIDSEVQLLVNMLVSMVSMLLIFLPLGITDVLFWGKGKCESFLNFGWRTVTDKNSSSAVSEYSGVGWKRARACSICQGCVLFLGRRVTCYICWVMMWNNYDRLFSVLINSWRWGGSRVSVYAWVVSNLFGGARVSHTQKKCLWKKQYFFSSKMGFELIVIQTESSCHEFCLH